MLVMKKLPENSIFERRKKMDNHPILEITYLGFGINPCARVAMAIRKLRQMVTRQAIQKNGCQRILPFLHQSKNLSMSHSLQVCPHAFAMASQSIWSAQHTHKDFRRGNTFSPRRKDLHRFQTHISTPIKNTYSVQLLNPPKFCKTKSCNRDGQKIP